MKYPARRARRASVKVIIVAAFFRFLIAKVMKHFLFPNNFSTDIQGHGVVRTKSINGKNEER